MRARPLVGILALGVLGFVSCYQNDLTLGPGAVIALRLSPDSAEVAVGGAVQMSAVPVDSTGALIPGRTVMWTSSNTTVASVNPSGLVVGLTPGVTNITAAAEGFSATAIVAVDLAPLIQFSADSVMLASTAGQNDGAPDSVTVTNGGGFTLEGLTLGTISFGAGATNWLTAVLDSMQAPATLALVPNTGAITAAGTYTAAVPVQSVGASNSPRNVVVALTVGADAPTAAAANDGDAQTATAGAAVATAPSLLVSDQFGNPVPGITVTFSVVGGGGSLTGATPTSDAQGIARVGSWTLGQAAGQNSIQAVTPGAAPVIFTATAVPDVADQILVNAGDNQSAVAGSPVAVPPSVLVADQFGNGVSSVGVTFAVGIGGGSATGTSQSSDGGGVATVGSWTLGSAAGANTLIATAPGLNNSPLTFTATGLSGAAENLILESGDAQTDTVAATLAQAYAVRVTDSLGNGVAGIQVAWTVTGGGGSITASSTTDGAGIATATRTLGTVAGPQTANAAVGGLIGSPVMFTATATAGAADVITLDQGAGQTATVNTAVGTDPSVLVSDQFGNPVPNHAVTFAVTAGGGTVDPVTPVNTGATGIATVTSWTLGTGAGTNNNTLTATAAGASVAGNPVAFMASATAGAATTITISAGDGQTAVVGTAVPTDPAALVTDTFGNPVANISVTFAVTAGGGSVSGASQTTDVNGVATVTSWTVQNGGGMSTTGTFANGLSATASVGSVAFTASGIYSYNTHVQPIWDANCTGCHGGTNGLFLNPPAATSHGNIVGVSSNCEPATDWIATGGGTAAETASIIMRLMDGGMCGTAPGMPTGGLTPIATRDTVRAWIRNGAPLN